MSSRAIGRYETALAELGLKGRLRALAPQSGVDFTSNDYLGLADAPRLKAAVMAAIEQGVPVGAGGSRLLRGNHWVHEALEAEAAAFFGVERALYFGSGFAANVALFSSLPQRGDLIIKDALIHASVHDGVAASRAETVTAAHNDVEAFDDAIRRWRGAGGKGHPWIAVESLYSMDGDRGPISELAELAARHDGFLVIDEAHATGVFGPGGRGLASDLEGRDNILVLHTCGKALGVCGALLGLPRVLAEFMVNRARNFIYSTAPPPLAAAAVREALRIVHDEPQRRHRLESLRSFAATELTSRLRVIDSGSQILPVIIGDNGRAVRVAERLQREGFDVRAVRPPTVPEGTARIRLTITINVEERQVAQMVDRLVVAIEESRP